MMVNTWSIQALGQWWDTSPEVANQRRHAIDAQCRYDRDLGNPLYPLP